jgi:hypothetical protein
VITPYVTGTQGDGGWYTSDVATSWTVEDPESNIANSTGCDPTNVTTDTASLDLSCTATNRWGTSATQHVEIKRDATPPTITYTGNSGSYTVGQTVRVTCSAADALSGVAATTCATISGPAWSFGLGTTTGSATASDRAGNTASATTSFTVVVTAASLDNLILRFFGGDRNGANGLISKVDAIVTAPNANAKNGKLGAFDNQVDAKIGKPLTAAQATLLKQLAAAL